MVMPVERLLRNSYENAFVDRLAIVYMKGKVLIT